MNEIKEKEVELKKVEYNEPFDKLYSLRITNSQYKKLKNNKKLKETIARYIRLCLETYPDDTI